MADKLLNYLYVLPTSYSTVCMCSFSLVCRIHAFFHCKEFILVLVVVGEGEVQIKCVCVCVCV